MDLCVSSFRQGVSICTKSGCRSAVGTRHSSGLCTAHSTLSRACHHLEACLQSRKLSTGSKKCTTCLVLRLRDRGGELLHSRTMELGRGEDGAYSPSRYLVKRPKALQWFYNGQLQKESEEERQAGRFELFLDLLCKLSWLTSDACHPRTKERP